MISSAASVFDTNPSAPASTARSTVPDGLNEVRISTCGAGESERSRRVASMPSTPGMAMSISTTSGFSSAARLTQVSPSVDVETTSMRPWE